MPLSHHNAITERHVGCLVVHIKHGTYVRTPCSLAAGADRLQCNAALHPRPCRKTAQRPVNLLSGPIAQTLCRGHGKRRIAAATNVTNSTLLGTKDSVTNVKNETNSAKDTFIGYIDSHRDSYVLRDCSLVRIS